jgi:hypothetical protein
MRIIIPPKRQKEPRNRREMMGKEEDGIRGEEEGVGRQNSLLPRQPETKDEFF